MTIKKAIKRIRKLTLALVNENNESKMDRIERKINILKDFIQFESN